jgi:hypothetical protein
MRREADALAGHTEMPGNDAPIRFHHGNAITEAEAVGFLVHDMWGDPFNPTCNIMSGRPATPVSNALWECRDRYLAYLPAEIRDARYLRELLNRILAFSESWLEERRRA